MKSSGAGIKPVSPALAGRFFTTEPLGKSKFYFLLTLLYNLQGLFMDPLLSQGLGLETSETPLNFVIFTLLSASHKPAAASFFLFIYLVIVDSAGLLLLCMDCLSLP